MVAKMKFFKNQKSYFVIEIIVFLCLIYVFFTRKYFLVLIQGDSMLPSLKNGQLVFCKKTDQIRLDQIVVFKRDNEFFIKRVKDLPGDCYLKSNTTPISYCDSFMWAENFEKCKRLKSFSTLYLKKDEFFVVGDNLYNSIDSKIFGPIKKSEIIGVVEQN